MTEPIRVEEEVHLGIIASCVSLMRGTGLIYTEDSSKIIQLAAFMTGEHELAQFMNWANMYAQICLSGLRLVKLEPRFDEIYWPEQPLNLEAQTRWYETLFETFGETMIVHPIPTEFRFSPEEMEYVEHTTRKLLAMHGNA